ncbi:MAG: DUF6111 family protein [Rhodopila sp.]
MRLIEIALFLSPFAAFALLRLLAPARGVPSWVLPVFTAIVVITLALLLYLRGLDAGDANKAYVPARLEDGRVLPSKAAPR